MEKPKLIYDRDRQGDEKTEVIPLREIQAALVEQLGSGEEGVTIAVDTALTQAVKHRASDLHFEPWEECVSLRYRIDGILHEIAEIPKEYQAKIIARIKILAKMVVYQKDVPQDGRIDPAEVECRQGMRVSTFPTVNGEKTVVRILGTTQDLIPLGSLGFCPEVVGALCDVIARPQGTLLLTGPSSSGKTTTIYALLRQLLELRDPPPHIVTIEDPVEYRVRKVAQTEVNPHAGFTFEAALRSILRQDPEVIVVGEIRDVETARIAIQAGLTGHLVISTIHSGSAAGVFTRLLDMGIESYLIASSVTGVLAQRLVRLNCSHCSEPCKPDSSLVAQYGIEKGSGSFRRGAGCEKCQGIGYRGRTAMGELLLVNDEISELILDRSRTQVLHEAALRGRMVTLVEDGVGKAEEGLTTLEELRRVLPIAGTKDIIQ